MDIREILELLPHRHPFLLVDKVIEFESGKRLVAVKNVTMNEPFFAGHFPGNPVMPGVLILEAMAQAAALLAFKSRQILEGRGRKPNEVCYFAAADHVRFKRLVIPGDQLLIEAELGKHKQGVWQIHTKATVAGQLACIADLMAALREVTS